MPRVSAQRTSIEVIVEVNRDLKHVATARKVKSEFRRYLEQYLGDLLADLDAPAEPCLSVQERERDHSFAMNPYQVTIDGQPCRLPLPMSVPPDAPPVALARCVAGAICHNRELLVTPSVCQRLCARWSAKDRLRLQHLSAGTVRQVFSQLARSALGLDRFRELEVCLPDEGCDEATAVDRVEDAIAGWGDVTLALLLSRSLPVEEGSLKELLDDMRAGLVSDMGVVFPLVQVERTDALAADEFQVRLNDLRLPPMVGLAADEFFVNCGLAELSDLSLTGSSAFDPEITGETAILRDLGDAQTRCRQAGFTTWTPAEFVVLKLALALRRNAGAFVSTDLMEGNLALLRESFPALVDAVETRYNRATLTRVLRSLLDEGLPIRDLQSILEGLLASNGSTPFDPGDCLILLPNTACFRFVGTEGGEQWTATDYAECVRMRLRRYITHRSTRRGNELGVCLVDPRLQTRLTHLREQPLTEQERQRLLEAIFATIADLPPESSDPVILTAPGTRWRLRKLIEREFPWLAVISEQELSRDTNISTLGHIPWT